MPESLGARLRERREQQHIALAAIASQTKIKQSLLDELERDDVSHWPSGIFRRAFIRAYAQALGMEPDAVVREFLELYPDPVETIEMISAVAGSAPKPSAGDPSQTRLRGLVGSAIGLLSRPRPAGSTGRASAPATPEETAVVRVPARPPVHFEPDYLSVARVCTELGRLAEVRGAVRLLVEMARILDAVGLIVWVWDEPTATLRPALAHGYSDKVLAQLPGLSRDAHNATAAAFRSVQMCAVTGSETTTGAVVAPLIGATGCVGVLAVELQHGNERCESARAIVTIFAAQISRLVAPTT
jgi:transcriptional regulator with XRE-family HTH domain